MDWLSLLSIFSFMQVQYFRITASAAPPLLSFTQALIHLTSSVVTAKAAVLVKQTLASSRAAAVFIEELRAGVRCENRQRRLARERGLGKERGAPKQVARMERSGMRVGRHRRLPGFR